ncbi:hypothetical protein MSAN_00119500 [Mycena sanguinolenta]|uniref:Uncharacterized protein n=1 Tax=Mycena sanguinolenta TaxID=230812 RepID=A0A8H6ZK84_9AGAR|nr:hypothetical protein MSAN_00119500 [Mycena sanguinolenta]
MNSQPNPNAEYIHSTTRDPESRSPAIGMFSHSRNFTVRGKNLTNITNNYAAPSQPSDFRMIPLADIDLRHEIRWNNSTVVVDHRCKQTRVRRLYSAEVEGRKSTLTVAIYQGDDAEQVHGILLSACGSLQINCVGMAERSYKLYVHAASFLIATLSFLPTRALVIQILFRSVVLQVQTGYTPRFSMMISSRFEKFWIVIEVPLFRRYIFMHAVYITFPPPMLYLTCRKNQDFSEAFNYIKSEFHHGLGSWRYTRWMRRSTGRLCTELTLDHDNLPIYANLPELLGSSRIYPLSACAEIITAFIDSLTLGQYHFICSWNLAQDRCFNICASTTVNLGAVFHCSGHPLENSDEIAYLPSAEAPILFNWTISGGDKGEVMPNGWTR